MLCCQQVQENVFKHNLKTLQRPSDKVDVKHYHEEKWEIDLRAYKNENGNSWKLYLHRSIVREQKYQLFASQVVQPYFFVFHFRKSLVDLKRTLLPPIHIKLGLMKQFVKALLKEGECFNYLCLNGFWYIRC